jgi:hypothetical protein
MAPDGIVEPVDVAANGLVGFLAGVEDSPPDELGFQCLKERRCRSNSPYRTSRSGCRAYGVRTSVDRPIPKSPPMSRCVRPLLRDFRSGAYGRCCVIEFLIAHRKLSTFPTQVQ